MGGLSDSIEKFIKDLLNTDAIIEIKRNELAQRFGCAPSQINYVLSTRFSTDRGYLVESRRGGSGYVKVIRLSPSESDLFAILCERIGSAIDNESARAILQRIYDMGIVSIREARLMRASVSCAGLAASKEAEDAIRAVILRNSLAQAFKNLQEE